MGSSSSSRLPPLRSSFARCSRLRSPPESLATFFCWSDPLKLNPAHVGAAVDGAVAELDLVLAAGDLLPYVLVGVERVAGLIDVGQFDRVAHLQRAGVGLLLAGDHAEQRRLAGAVRADHPDDPAAGQVEAEVVDQHPVAVGLAQPGRLDHRVAEPGTGGDVDLDLVELDVAVLGEERLVGVEAGLGLVPARARVEADPLELLVDRALARALLLLLVLQPGALLLEPARVIALVRDAAPAVELEDPAGDVVEEVAVVGDRDDRPRVILEVALEPRDRFRVEVVGRLVEQQQIRLSE